MTVGLVFAGEHWSRPASFEIGGRDHRERYFLVDVRRGDGDPGVQVADDGDDVLVRDHVPCVGDADVGLGLIVERHDLDLVPHRLQRTLVLFHCQLRAQLDAFAERSLAATERALRRDLDRALTLGVEPRAERQEGDGQRRTHSEDAASDGRFHEMLPPGA